MTIEDKKLLFKDLCARLPYSVKIKIWLKDGTTEEGTLALEHNYGDVLRDAFYYNKIVDIKPYLRSMEDMTEEEEEEFVLFTDTIFRYGKNNNFCCLSLDAIHWLLKKHFDYRGLIPKGLAIKMKML